MLWGEKPAGSIVWRIAFLLLVLSVFGFSTQSRLQLPSFRWPSSCRACQAESTQQSGASFQRLKVEELLGDALTARVLEFVEPAMRPTSASHVSHTNVAVPSAVFLAPRAIRPPPTV